MGAVFYVLARSSQRELLEKLALNLTPDKPVFVEDVEPEWQVLYKALEFMPWPRVLVFLDERLLLVGWSVDFDPFELASLVKPLLASGAQVPVGAVRLEEGEVFSDGALAVAVAERGDIARCCVPHPRCDEIAVLAVDEPIAVVVYFISARLGATQHGVRVIAVLCQK